MRTLAVDFAGRGAVGLPGLLCQITRRDGVVIRIAQTQRPYTIAGKTFSPVKGCLLYAYTHTNDGAMASTQIDAVLDESGPFRFLDVLFKKFDAAEVRYYQIDRANPTTLAQVFRGYMGQISTSPVRSSGLVSFAVQGQSAKIGLPFIPVYGPMCRTDLGSGLCGVPILCGNPIGKYDVARGETIALGNVRRVDYDGLGLPAGYRNRILEATAVVAPGHTAGSAPTFTDGLGDIIVDGNVTWTVRESYTRFCTIANIIDRFTFTLSGFTIDPRVATDLISYNQGVIVLRSGVLANMGYEIGLFDDGTAKITSYLPIGDCIATGDLAEIFPGCNKTWRAAGGCKSFRNQRYFVGEPLGTGGRAASAQTQLPSVISVASGTTGGGRGVPPGNPQGSVEDTLGFGAGWNVTSLSVIAPIWYRSGDWRWAYPPYTPADPAHGTPWGSPQGQVKDTLSLGETWNVFESAYGAGDGLLGTRPSWFVSGDWEWSY